MNQSSKTSINGFIVTFETILVFIVGVLGNKVSENLSIPGSTLLILTGLCLGALAAISYSNASSGQRNVESDESLKRLIPKTMIGIFPFGMFLGFLFGALVPPLQSTNSFIVTVQWSCRG